MDLRDSITIDTCLMWSGAEETSIDIGTVSRYPSVHLTGSVWLSGQEKGAWIKGTLS